MKHPEECLEDRVNRKIQELVEFLSRYPFKPQLKSQNQSFKQRFAPPDSQETQLRDWLKDTDAES